MALSKASEFEFPSGMSTLIAFAAYLAVVIAVGLWASRRGSDSDEDFFLGGRRLGPFAVALSAVSSGRSAWLVIGASAIAWQQGLPALWLFPGYIAIEALVFVTLGPRLRRRSEELGAITIPEVLEKLSTGGARSAIPIRMVAGAICVLFLVTYLSAQLVAGGKTLEAVFEVSGDTWGLCITAGIVLVYTMLGGYRAVVITDVIQALLMLLGLLVLPLLAVHSIGGFDTLLDTLRVQDPGHLEWTSGMVALFGALAIGLGSLGNPHILVRHMSLKDPTAARTAMLWGTIWNIAMAGGALLLGLAGRVLYPTLESFASGGREELYPRIALDMSTGYALPGFLGVLLASLFAAIMSTCDSQLLVIASSLIRDFRDDSNPESESTWKSRVVVVVALVIAVALSFGESIFVGRFVLFSWAALGAAFGPPLTLLLYGLRIPPLAVVLAMIAGASTVVIWGWIEALDALIYELVPGFVVSSLIAWIGSTFAKDSR